jgi:steroid delta-isomerase-like uncharacterized protein
MGHKEIVAVLFGDVINKGRFAALERVMAPDFVDHLAAGQAPGRAGFEEFLKMLAGAFPDIQAQVEDVFSEGDKVAVRLTVTGTHTGLLLGRIPATGKRAAWTGIDILRIENGKIKERWSERNLLSLMRQLGAVP